MVDMRCSLLPCVLYRRSCEGSVTSSASCVVWIPAAPKKIMQQFLEKSFPMETELGDREMDLLAYQVCTSQD